MFEDSIRDTEVHGSRSVVEQTLCAWQSEAEIEDIENRNLSQ